MSVASFINWIISHNIVVIEGLIGVIVVSVLALAFRLFFSNARDELGISGDTKSLSSLEESLKKVIEKVNLGAVPAPVAAGAPLSAESSAEYEELKKSLETKNREVEELHGQITALKEMSVDSEEANRERAKFELKAKELEAKLAEYEIISEDIADLSMYKEENAKLKKEVESLKAAAAAAPPIVAAAAVPVAAAPAPAPEVSAPALAPAPPPPAPAPAPTAQTPLAAAPAPDFGAALDDDIMAEFAKAVEDQLTSKAAPAAAPAPVAAAAPVAPPPAPAAPEPPAPAAPVAAVADEADTQSMVDDLLSKMTDEAGSLGAEPAGEVPNPIDQSMDENKLAEEAATFEKIKEDDMQLMGQFENFVKKGAS